MKGTAARVLAVAAVSLSAGLMSAVPPAQAHGGLSAATGRMVGCREFHLHGVYGRIPLRVQGVRCRFGRSLARAWERRRVRSADSRCVFRDGSVRPGSCTVDGWRCLAFHTTNGATYPVVCSHGPAARRTRVRFVMRL